MSKLTRVLQSIFASNANPGELKQFGSLANGTPLSTTDPAVIQALPEFKAGWFAAVIGGGAPAIEDMNALQFVYARQLAYLFQAGVAEWETNTVYYQGSLVNDGFGNIYVSLTDNNHGNALSSVANWAPILASAPQNFLINGNMDLAQRKSQSSAGLSGSFAYQTVDRFALKLNGTFTGTPTSQQSTTVPTNNQSQYSVVFNAQSTTGAEQVIAEQRIESIHSKLLSGRSFSVSFWVMHNFTGNLTAAVDVITPTALNNYASTTTQATQSLSGIAPGTWTKVVFKGFNVANLDNGLGIDFKFSGFDTGSAKNLYFTQAMVTPGGLDQSSSFSYFGGSLNSDILGCFRYYQKTYLLYVDPETVTPVGALIAPPLVDSGGGFNSARNIVNQNWLKAPMFQTPTATFYTANSSPGVVGSWEQYNSSTNHFGITGLNGLSNENLGQYLTQTGASVNTIMGHITLEAEI